MGLPLAAVSSVAFAIGQLEVGVAPRVPTRRRQARSDGLFQRKPLNLIHGILVSWLLFAFVMVLPPGRFRPQR